MIDLQTQLEMNWQRILATKLNNFHCLTDFLNAETQVTYPPKDLIFNAFNLCPFNQIKVVIIGQDPYHGEGQANGLCFAVNDGVKIPPSLRNIFKELHSDLGIEIPTSGNLERWAKQGVLLLNSILTVQANQAASHRNKGWEQFTDIVIKQISEQREQIVFLLWGNYAHKKGSIIDTSKHYILKSAHPSPLSARNFFGNQHFSKTNQYLTDCGKTTINW
ncbi:uracil-DNA glycosylase [Candidatus Halobeggiatoa sp. HSG11]|nr:uracil-DNA glycosylase [Candidatus Halobeggiatoa sp. HSG11]